MYDTIIVFDRVRENIPRMPRAAFSQIVNRSMSEVLTRSLATTTCTLMPIVALLLFGGVAGSSELQDFAFALLIGVASGAYSSIFIASPVLTHWKEREPAYRARRLRIVSDQGFVPAYADAAGDVEPAPRRPRRPGRLSAPEPEAVSAAEFEQMKRDLEIEPAPAPRGRGTSTLTRPPSRPPKPQAPRPAKPAPQEAPPPQREPQVERDGGAQAAEEPFERAPDVAENEGMVPTPPKPKRSGKSRPRNRRHGRRR
jgi:SecD/SecF fusion protein